MREALEVTELRELMDSWLPLLSREARSVLTGTRLLAVDDDMRRGVEAGTRSRVTFDTGANSPNSGTH